MASAWLDHVKKTMGEMKGQPFKDVLKAAAKTYKKMASPDGSKSAKRKSTKRKSTKK